MPEKILIAGGDLRFITLAECLSEKYDVFSVGFDRSIVPSGNVCTLKSMMELKERMDYAVLPLPATNDGFTVNTPYSAHTFPIESLATVVREGGTIFGGRLPDSVTDFFTDCGIHTADYSKREEFAVMNAIATAEGAIQVAMEETARILSGQKILIVGMGRIAKLLIRILGGFGADITVAARKYSDIAWAEAYGCKGVTINGLSDVLNGFSIIFNTVPAIILDEQKLHLLNSECLVIDLASKPGGVDFDTASQLGIRTIWLLSLPGKVAPVTSGEIIARTLENIMEERGNANENRNVGAAI